MAKRSPLQVQESVRLVLPTHADFGSGHAHVARASAPERTLCGTRIRSWWFWHPGGDQTVAALREEWHTRNCFNGLVHFHGTHLSGPVDMRPDVCVNCWMIVVEGRRPRWANAWPEDLCCYCGQPSEYCWCDATEDEALDAHGPCRS